MWANHPKVEFLRTIAKCRKREELNYVVTCVLPLYNVKLGIFTSQSCSDGKEMYKKAWYTCKIVVLVIKPIAFVEFPLPSPSSSSDLKVPIKASSFFFLIWTFLPSKFLLRTSPGLPVCLPRHTARRLGPWLQDRCPEYTWAFYKTSQRGLSESWAQ